MRVNRYLAEASDLSRRGADQAIKEGRVMVNGQPAELGQMVKNADQVSLDGHPLVRPSYRAIMFYKPAGAVCSRRRQGNTQTIYELLPPELQNLNPVGRLDKDTSGLLILTNDGQLHQQLIHPSQGKNKRYEVELDHSPRPVDLEHLKNGVELDDGPSRPRLIRADGRRLTVELEEGRNRQVRRTFAALGYTVTRLHRSQLSGLTLEGLQPGEWREINPTELPS